MITTITLLTLALNLQATETAQTIAPVRGASPTRIAVPSATGAVATHATVAPVIDGRDDDQVWATAPAITGFKEWQPTEGKEPRFKTEAKVAYDAANLYVFVRAFDPHPDSIIRLLERRDTFTPSDMVWVFIDSYHDRRTGYEFGVNAAGVKIDQAVYDGGNEDGAWDAVWDVATRIDSLGWTAEFRIPFSQMRYSTARTHTFGFTIDRDIYRYAERVSWPTFSQAKPDMVSQLGSLGGLDNLEAPRRLEALPYAVSKSASQISNNRYGQHAGLTAGGDLKYRVAPNVTLDATVNPDFGQVESDPAVLNLSAYESFFDERRPFFVAGRGLFRFDVNCNQVNCSNEGLYYSRRIGRTPELAGVYGDTIPLQPTTIIGAAKLLGRFPNGLTFGLLDATTERSSGPGGKSFEPMTNFGVARVRQDLWNGNSSIGAMFTAVNRSLDQWSSPYLPADAYTGAMDFRHRILGNYEISGSLDQSRVQGSATSILSLQRDAVHYYQRPDAALPLDSERTLLNGDAEEFKFGKVGGQHLMFESAYQRRSPGFEVNDIGFLRRADQQSWSTWVGFFDRTQRALYNRFQWNNNWWQYWTAAGLPLEAAYNTNVHLTFKNNWNWNAGGTVGQLGTTFDDRAARGGPAIRQDSYIAPWMGINGDSRRSVVPMVFVNYYRGNAGRNRSLGLNPEVDYKLGGQFSSAFSLNWSHDINDHQWFGNFTDSNGQTHYTFAHLDQNTTSATVRLNYTFSPAVSLQVYTQPFISKGAYSNVRQLSSNPRAVAYDDRFAAYNNPAVTSDPGGFNFKEFQSNVVFRWEYRPGSTLFLVWNEGRQGFASAEGVQGFGGDVRDLARLHPANTFLVKMSYWLNR
jgi:Domain of unknown function (DUF5916)/Carbohydrate family 9 binding domain-like